MLPSPTGHIGLHEEPSTHLAFGPRLGYRAKAIYFAAMHLEPQYITTTAFAFRGRERIA